MTPNIMSAKRNSNDKKLTRKHKLIHTAAILEIKNITITNRYSPFCPNLSTETNVVNHI